MCSSFFALHPLAPFKHFAPRESAVGPARWRLGGAHAKRALPGDDPAGVSGASGVAADAADVELTLRVPGAEKTATRRAIAAACAAEELPEHTLASLGEVAEEAPRRPGAAPRRRLSARGRSTNVLRATLLTQKAATTKAR